MTFTLPSHLFHIEEEDDQPGSCSRAGSEEEKEKTDMKLTELSYDRIREAAIADLYNISKHAGIQDYERLNRSEDMRERLILMKRKMEGTSNNWKPLFKSVQCETKVKIDSLIHLMKAVEETFQTIPTESLSEILRKEGHLQSRNLLEELSSRMRNLKERRSLVVVAGETNGGKSTFLNLLLGEDILPTYVLHCTFAVCKIVYSDVYSIKTLDHNDIEEHFPCSTREEVMTILRNKVTRQGTIEREFESPVKEITLGVPADILKSGVILVDTPGIGENEVMDSVTMNFVKSTHASAFIYIIKSDTAGGVQEDRLISFLRAIKDRYSSDSMMEAFDPKAAMFVCHRWDNINEKHREKVKMNALNKLEYVWPGFDTSQMYFFSTTDTMKHLPVDPEFVTDSFMSLLKGLKQIFDRACHNAIKNQYLWLKYMLHPASKHLKSMITHCIMSNEELEEYFKSVSVKQNKLMISSTENSRKLQTELDGMSCELKSIISQHLNFDTISSSLEIPNSEEIIETCSKENFLVNQANRRVLDEMIIHSLLRRIDEFVYLQKVVSEMESKILIDIQDHLGLFKCQIGQIKHDMLHEVNHRASPSHPNHSFDDPTEALRVSTDSIVSIGLNTSSIEAFKDINTNEPSQLSEMVKSLLIRRKEGKSTKTTAANYKHEIGQSLLGKIGDKIKHSVFQRVDPAIYVEERIRKVSKNIREDADIMDIIVRGYTEWIQQCVTHAVNSIPKFIEVNTKLMEEIRDHRTIFQRNKDLLVKVMENLEPCRHNLRGYGLLYMNDINAESVAFNTEHRTVSLPKYLLTDSSYNFDSGFQESIDDCLWSKIQGATIEVDSVASRVVIKTYTYYLDEKLILPEIASLRFLDYVNLAPFLGMTRIAAASTKSKPSSSSETEASLPDKVSAFIFKGDLLSAKLYSTRKIDMQQFIPDMVQSLLRGINYIHREGLVHMELNLKTVMVDKVTGTVKLCHMCKPREAIFPSVLDTPTKSYVCLSPSVLQGNVYESTDDIYAFGLLLWELLFPDRLPFKEERLWTLQKFIEKCHPSSMLQEDLSELQVSDSVREVLKGTLLISRGHVFMSLATIQSFLTDLYKEPAVLAMKTKDEQSVLSNQRSNTLPAPEVQVISPKGTGTKIEFMYDKPISEPDEASFLSLETTKFPTARTCSSGNPSLMFGEQNHKKENTYSLPRPRRRISEPDIKKIVSPSPKMKLVKILRKVLGFGSSNKTPKEELKPAETNDIINNSRRHSETLPHEIVKIKTDSLELETPPLRQKFKQSDTLNANQTDFRCHGKHTSLPSQLFFGQKTGSLTRKESFDVPTLMSEKFKLSVTNRVQRNGASKLDPLSSLKSNSKSGSMPSLLFLSESLGHNTESTQKQQSSVHFTSSVNSKNLAGLPPNYARKKDLTIPYDMSSPLKQRQLLAGSLRDLSDNSFNSANPKKYIMNHRASTSDLYDKQTRSSISRENHVIATRKSKSWTVYQQSPLTLTSQNVLPLPLKSSNSSTSVFDVEPAENKSTLLLSSSTSSRGADSGFSTDTSWQGAKDILGSNNDLQSTSISCTNSINEKCDLNDNIDYNLIYNKSQNVQTNNSAINVGKFCPHSSAETKMSSLVKNYKDDAVNDKGDNTEISEGHSLQDLRDDSEVYSHMYVHAQKSEPLNETRNKSMIPPAPAPINLSELFLKFGSYDDSDDSEE